MLKMLDRVTLIGRMEALKLDMNNTQDYSMQQLIDTCDRMEACGAVYLGGNCDTRIQQELILNPLFAKVYKELSEQGVYGYTLQCWLEEADSVEDKLTNYTKEQLTFEGVTFILDTDIDLNNKPWSPICSHSASHPFRGTFEGNGHTIKNMYSPSNGDENMYAGNRNPSGKKWFGLFGFLAGTVKNEKI